MKLDEENLRPSQINSPSKLPAPKNRKQFFSNESAGQLSAQTTQAAPANFATVGNCPSTTSATASVRTFRVNGTSTSRPPVTKVRTNTSIRSSGRAPSQTVAKKSFFAEAVKEVDIAGKKRPAWDTRGRLEDMEALTDALKTKILESDETQDSLLQKLSASEQRVRELEMFRENLNTTVHVKEEENSQIEMQLQEMKTKFESELISKELELTKFRTQMQCELEIFTQQRDRLKADLDVSQTRIQDFQNECNALKGTISRNAATMLDLESQINALKAKIDLLKTEKDQTTKEASSLQEQLNTARAIIKDLECKVYAGEALRRKLHNTVQELKGNIRVFCRVRPTLSNEPSDLSHMVFAGRNAEEQEEIHLVQASESASGKLAEKVYSFAFDKVFGPTAHQADVFEEISQLVQSALDGYRVCIFAYGQTGSGKTFTMEGPPERTDTSHSGMIPRAVDQIFSTAAHLADKGWSFGFEASYLEIYNESIRDLSKMGPLEDSMKYEIRHVNGLTTVSDLNIVRVERPEHVMDLLSKAAHNRAVAETQCNDRSSRSHSVFSLRITGENAITTEKVNGLLNLIDLAGSERLSQSGSTGDRLKETQAINKSLSSLGDVIYALANKDAHVPFRNSKLTYLLQHSLGGNCKTLMFVNVSPAKGNLQETLCSLRFATKVNSCQIGTARKATSK